VLKTLSAAAASGEKSKRKREDRASIHEATVLARLFFADRSFATLILLLTLLCIIGMGLLAFFASAPRLQAFVSFAPVRWGY
jgi:hypothetical protein